MASPYANQSTSHSDRLEPEMRASASRGSAPDVDIYEKPNTNRESSANLSLSIMVMLFAGILAIALLFWVF